MPYPLPDVPSGVDEDAWASAVAQIRGYCGWHIAPEVTETLTLDGPGGYELFLPTLRLVDLVSITNDGSAVTEPQWSRSGRVGAGYWSCWTWKMRGVVAEITHGYEEWPEDLVALATDMVSGDSGEVVAGLTSGPFSVRFESPASSRRREVLDRYSLVALA
jgi:hypothetical protein